MEAVVEFEYTAEQEDELNLKVGEIITNVKTSDGGWWEGELRGKKGLFPENFVQLVQRREAASSEAKREPPQRKSVRELASKFKDMSVGGPPKKKEKQKKCKVLFEYKKENDDELELAVGDIVDFHKEVEDGWWEGSLNGKQGVFPSNFVEMLDETPPSSGESTAPVVEEKDKDKPAGDTQSKDADFHTIKGKKVVGVGLGNIFGGGPIKLRAVADSSKKEDTPKSSPQEPSETAPETAVREKANTIERAVVRFSYVAEQPDELSLTEGQIVRILEKELEDDGWWKGEVNGKVGVFPDNFVELLPSEKTVKPQKPPPPAVAATTKSSQPKLPDKPPASDVADEKVKTECHSPSLSKKPQVPPPIIKKPVNQKSTELKSEPSVPHQEVSAVRDRVAIRENHTENNSSQGTIQFDDIEPAGQKLTHLTYGRAQGPKKRPPSSVLLLNDGEKDTTEQVKNSHLPAPEWSRLPDKLDMEKSQSSLPDRPPDRSEAEKPQSRLPDRPGTEKPHSRLPDRPEMEKSQSRLPDRSEKPVPILPPKDYNYRSAQSTQQTDSVAVNSHSSTVTSLRDRELHLNTPPPRPPEPTKAPPSSQATSASQIQAKKLLEQLQQELVDLKANTVSKSAFLELRVQHEKLKVEFESLKKIHSAKIRDLANEVDEEKKLRLITQVEIERVKKFLAETNV